MLILNTETLAGGSYEISIVNGDVVISNYSKKSHDPDIIGRTRLPNKIVNIQNNIVTNYYYEQPDNIYSQLTAFNDASCWYQLDPYTFMGEIFGYDYDYFCR